MLSELFNKKMNKEIKKFLVKRSKSGLGLFANTLIKKGEFVIQYTGKLLTRKEANKKGGKYLFEINSRWTIDGSGRENIARYINHSCRPNCEVDIINKEIKIFAIKDIKTGEELCYDYGKEYFNEFIKPFGCRCAHCRKLDLKTN
jgi:SET domain-containing protein